MWIARDSNGELWIYREKPIKSNKVWLSDEEFEELQLEGNWFPEVQWSDEEPRELILLPAPPLYHPAGGGTSD